MYNLISAQNDSEPGLHTHTHTHTQRALDVCGDEWSNKASLVLALFNPLTQPIIIKTPLIFACIVKATAQQKITSLCFLAALTLLSLSSYLSSILLFCLHVTVLSWLQSFRPMSSRHCVVNTKATHIFFRFIHIALPSLEITSQLTRQVISALFLTHPHFL